MAAREPADSTTERVADDADVGRRAGKGGEPVLTGGHGQIAPEDTGLDAGSPSDGIDLDPAHPHRLDEQHVAEILQRHGGVPRPLRRQA